MQRLDSTQDTAGRSQPCAGYFLVRVPRPWITAGCQPVPAPETKPWGLACVPSTTKKGHVFLFSQRLSVFFQAFSHCEEKNKEEEEGDKKKKEGGEGGKRRERKKAERNGVVRRQKGGIRKTGRKTQETDKNSLKSELQGFLAVL